MVHTSASATYTRLSLIFLLTKGTTTKCIAHPPSTTTITTTKATTPEGESENEGAEGEEEGSEGILVDKSSEEKSLSFSSSPLFLSIFRDADVNVSERKLFFENSLSQT
jgi:hypothetical protein